MEPPIVIMVALYRQVLGSLSHSLHPSLLPYSTQPASPSSLIHQTPVCTEMLGYDYEMEAVDGRKMRLVPR